MRELIFKSVPIRISVVESNHSKCKNKEDLKAKRISFNQFRYGKDHGYGHHDDGYGHSHHGGYGGHKAKKCQCYCKDDHKGYHKK